jgi:hypothetical protein
MATKIETANVSNIAQHRYSGISMKIWIKRFSYIRPLLSRIFLLVAGVHLSSTIATAVYLQEDVKAQAIRPETTAGLQAFYQALDYDWQNLETGVPPFILEKVPEDIDKAVSTKEKKQAFFMGLLPMVLIANLEILQDRNEIQEILARHNARQLRKGDKERLDQIEKRYGLSVRPLIDHRARTLLLQRADRQ